MSAKQVLLTALLAIALAGCAATAEDYASDRELGSRPGLFSGEDGAFVVRVGEGARPAPTAPTADDYEAFLLWKDSPQRAAEQREFDEWRQWQQFREWKKRQVE